VVEFSDLEQVEPGDTLTHTWIISTWPENTRHWFYFFGKLGATFSACTTAIYTYFHDYFYTSDAAESWTLTIVPPPDYELVFTEHW